MNRNKHRALTPAAFGITYKGRTLKEFNDWYVEELGCGSSQTFRQYLPIYAGSLGFAGAAAAAAALRSSDAAERALLLVLPCVLAAVIIASIFIKDNFIRTQTVSDAGVLSVSLMFRTFVCAGIKGRWVLYVMLLLLTLICIAAGMRGWARHHLRAQAKSKGGTVRDLSQTRSIVSLISIGVIPIIRGLRDARGVLDALMIAVSVFLCITLGLIAGLGINNIRYYRSVIKENRKQ